MLRGPLRTSVAYEKYQTTLMALLTYFLYDPNILFVLEQYLHTVHSAHLQCPVDVLYYRLGETSKSIFKCFCCWTL